MKEGPKFMNKFCVETLSNQMGNCVSSTHIASGEKKEFVKAGVELLPVAHNHQTLDQVEGRRRHRNQHAE